MKKYFITIFISAVVLMASCTDKGSLDYSFDVSFEVKLRVVPEGKVTIVDAPWMSGSNPLLVSVGKNQVISLENMTDDGINSFFGVIAEEVIADYEANGKGSKESKVHPISFKLTGEASKDGTKIKSGKVSISSEWTLYSEVTKRFQYEGDISSVSSSTSINYLQQKTSICWEDDWNTSMDCDCRWFCTIGCTPCPAIVKSIFGGCWTTKCRFKVLWLECRCDFDQQVPCPDCS